LKEKISNSKLLKKIFGYFKRNWEGVKNQGINDNIGVSAESDVSHLVKQSLGYGGRIYNIEIFDNILARRAYNFNSTGRFRG
jgi:hypothetical protein